MPNTHGKDKSQILLIDGGAQGPRSLANALRKADCRVERAANASEALERIACNGCDAVLLTVRRPGSKALEALRCLRAVHPRGKLPVILLAGAADPPTLGRALAEGANDFLILPIDPETLLVRLRVLWACARAMQGNSSGAACPRADPVPDPVRAANGLGFSQRMLQAVFDAIPHGLFVKDCEGRYLMVNRGLASLANRRPEEFVGVHTLEAPFGTEAQRLMFQDTDRKVLQTGRAIDVPDFRFTTPDGQTQDRHLIKLPLRNARGEMIGVLGISQDISQLKGTERKLGFNQRLLQAIFDHLPLPLFLKDAHGRFIMVNPALTEQYGLSPDQILRRNELKIPMLRPEERDAYMAQDRAVLLHGETVEVPEMEYTDSAGRRGFQHVRKVPLRNAQGEIVRLLGISEDITERKRAEEELIRARRLLRAVIDTLPLWITVKDREDRYLLVNQARAEASALTIDDFPGRKTLEMPRTLRGSLEQIAALDRQVLETGGRIEVPEFRVEVNGKEQLRRVVLMPLRDEAGHIVGVVGFSEDITDRVRAENELRQAQKMEAVGQLTGGVAHDFNNLLQIIGGYLQLMGEHPGLPGKVPEYLHRMGSATERATSLTRQLLAFSRQNVLQPRTLDLNALVTNLEKMVKLLVGEQVKLEWRPGEKVEQVLVDAGAIEQVLLNLCINARDAMPGGGHLELATHPFMVDETFARFNGWEQAGPYVMLTVTDTGTGMTREVQERIFEPFFTTKEIGKGTGLGLSMVYGLIRQQQGKIVVYSEPGVGTTFKIYLPVCEEACREDQDAKLEPVRGGDEVVLVVEDAEDVLALVEHLLGGMGYTVLTARNGEEALALFRQEADRIDLVILDVIMPKMVGKEAFERMRSISPGVPALFMTGYAGVTFDQEYIDKFGLRLIQKPFPPNELFAAVRDILDRKRGLPAKLPLRTRSRRRSERSRPQD